MKGDSWYRELYKFSQSLFSSKTWGGQNLKNATSIFKYISEKNHTVKYEYFVEVAYRLKAMIQMGYDDTHL